MKALDQNWEAIYPHPPEHVWRALTDPKELADWLLPGDDFVAQPGKQFEWRQGTQTIQGEVLVVEKPKHLSYTWQRLESDEPLTVVTWNLEPVEGGGTRLRLTHVSAEPVRVRAKIYSFRTKRSYRMAV